MSARRSPRSDTRPGSTPQQFHLIAPYTRDARQWTKLRWIDVYSGERFTITTREVVSGEGTARMQLYREVIDRYRVHPEAKSLGPAKTPCGKRTVGLLHRRSVALGELVHIGKETNRLEEVEQGLVHDWNEVQLVFREPNDYVEASKTTVETNVTMLRLCPSCATPIIGARQLYCSSACRQRAHRERVQSARIR